MKNGATVYLYELAWILPSIAIPDGMLAALLVTAPFHQLGVVQTGPLRYEVRMVSQIWSFTPNEIHVPVGSTVTFIATSRDVIHGLFIPGVNINVMLIPGQISRVTAHFDRVGEYFIACHEYCGIAHHTMGGKVIVEPRS